MAADPARLPFAAEVEQLAARLAVSARPINPVVLYGSSTVRLWPDPRFDTGCANLLAVGFGGARLADLDARYDRLVPPLGPGVLIIAAGANDMERDGAGPDAIVARTAALVERARRHDPQLPIGIFLMKPAPAHGVRLAAMRAVNRALADRFGAAPAALSEPGPEPGSAPGPAQTAGRPPVTRLIDGFTPLLGPDGQADAGCYAADRRHFGPAGYACWGRLIAAALPLLSRPAGPEPAVNKP